MKLMNLAVFLGLCLLAVSPCTEARHSMHRRETDDDIFAADEASDDDGTQNDELFEDKPETLNEVPAVQASILTEPKVYEVKPGSNVTLECSVDHSDTVVQWYKGNDLYFMNTIKTYSEGEDIKRFSIVPDSKNLLIENVEPSDGGVYKCELAQSTLVKVEHTLVVLEPPRILRFTATNHGSLIEGTDLVLTCDVRGKPPPTIAWSRDDRDGNRRLGEQDGEFSANQVLIRNVKREHAGKYYCYAFNSLNGSQAELLITVTGKPRVHVHKPVINSAINVQALLQCSAHYDYNPHIRWYKDGRLIEDSLINYNISSYENHSNLTVTPSRDEDFGTYTCEAENNIGRHNRSIELVQRPVIESLKAEGGKLTWTVHSHQPLQEIHTQLHQIDVNGSGEWKKYEIPLPAPQKHKYEIIYDLNDKNLEAGRYEAVVKVKNDHSWSDNSDPLIFDIELKPQPIQHASMFGGGASTAQLSSLVFSTFIMYLLVRLL